MIIRTAPLFAALTLWAAPALAQESAEDSPLPVDEPAPAEASSEATAAEPAAAGSEAATAEPTPQPALAEASPEVAAAEPAPQPAPATAATPALQPTVVASPFSPDQRNGWLSQCRATFLRAGAVLGGANGMPDACETQLLDFERSYVPPADGQPAAPVILVRVPVVRQPPPAPPAESVEE